MIVVLSRAAPSRYRVRMNEREIDAFLERSLADGRLSRGERGALRDLVGDADATTLQRVRARAFAIARGTLIDPSTKAAIDWLERISALLASLGETDARPSTADVLFSPGDACVRTIGALFDGARRTVDACVFTITDDRIVAAIQAAHRRGVRIRIVSDDDKADDLGSDLDRLAAAGVPVALDRSPAHMHHKFAIFDGRTGIVGSYNWTRAAANENEEDLVVTDDERIVRALEGEFERLWGEYGGGATRAGESKGEQGRGR